MILSYFNTIFDIEIIYFVLECEPCFSRNSHFSLSSISEMFYLDYTNRAIHDRNIAIVSVICMSHALLTCDKKSQFKDYSLSNKIL